MRDAIKKHSDFITDMDVPIARSHFFLVKIVPTRFADGARYGIMATKKTFKFAFQRNRAKRLIRDWARFCEKYMMPEYDYIFIARTGILDATRDDGRQAMTKALKYLKVTNGTKK